MKRLLAIILTACLLTIPSVELICVADSEEPQSLSYSDVPLDYWAAVYIQNATKKGWVTGYPDGSFRPDNAVTRAEFVKMLLCAEKLYPGSTVSSYYEDPLYTLPKSGLKIYNGRNWNNGRGIYEDLNVSLLKDMENHWLTVNGYSDLALKSGIIVGSDYASGYFQPDLAITRNEVVVMADRALGLIYQTEQETGKSSFTDIGDCPGWLKPYLVVAQKAGVVNGYPDGSFRGDATISRAEALTVINRVIDVMEKDINPDLRINFLYTDYSGTTSMSERLETTVPSQRDNDGVLYVDAIDLIKRNAQYAENFKLFSYSYDQVSQIITWNGGWSVDPTENRTFCSGPYYAYIYNDDNRYTGGEQITREVITRMEYGRMLIPVYIPSYKSKTTGDARRYGEFCYSYRGDNFFITYYNVENDAYTILMHDHYMHSS